MLYWLAFGPRSNAMSYNGYIINGQRFRTKRSEKSRQNSGVSIEAEPCRSAEDSNEVLGNVFYYGILQDIILLDYHTFRVPLFKCDWAHISNDVKREDGFILVNLRDGQSMFKKDPFILASQAKQVFYSRESDTSSWHVALKAPPRGFHDIEMSSEGDDYTPYAALDKSIIDSMCADEDVYHARNDCDGFYV